MTFTEFKTKSLGWAYEDGSMEQLKSTRKACSRDVSKAETIQRINTSLKVQFTSQIA